VAHRTSFCHPNSFHFLIPVTQIVDTRPHTPGLVIYWTFYFAAFALEIGIWVCLCPEHSTTKRPKIHLLNDSLHTWIWHYQESRVGDSTRMPQSLEDIGTP
jgi:hypothetical protein